MRWALWVLAAITVSVGCASSGVQARAHAEMREGVRAAQRNYWQEAFFRFQNAKALEPSDPEVLNNLAVALEALGRYDEALATYKQALQGGSKPTALRRNYARFAEFFTSYAKGVKPKDITDASH